MTTWRITPTRIPLGSHPGILFKLILVFLGFSCFASAKPTIGGCPAFPATNIWNVPVTGMPVLTNSLNMITAIGGTSGLNAFLRIDDTMPINVVPANTAKVTMATINTESDLGPWPIPAGVVSEGGNDKHLIVIDQGTCILYEAFLAVKQTDGTWNAYSIAKWDLGSNALRPPGNTSADAAGLAITPGILRYSEALAGPVNHALRVTVPSTYGYTFIWPARHYSSHATDTNLPPMGQRLRLKASFDLTPYSGVLRNILQGLKTYGMIVSDNGMSWGMQHDQDAGWGGVNLVALHNILGSNVEAVDVGALMSDSDSGVAVMPPPTGLFMTDQLGRKNSVPLGSGLSIQNGQIVAGGAYAVTHVAGRTGDVILGIGDITNLSTKLSSLDATDTQLTNALSTKQNTIPYTPEQALNFSAPLARSGNTISCPTCQTGSGSTAHSGTATFASTDAVNKGNWKGVYAVNSATGGYQIVGDTTKLPVYATLTAAGNQTVTWANSTNDDRALQKAGNGRIAAAWYTPTGMTIDLNLADGLTHKVALYFVDWDHLGRKQQITITDLQGNTLDSQPLLTNFDNGKYMIWNIKDRVVIRITKDASTSASATAVVSGIFFE